MTEDTFSIKRLIKKCKNVTLFYIRLNFTCFLSLYFFRCNSISWTLTSSLFINSFFLCSFFTSFFTCDNDEKVVNVKRSDKIDLLESLRTDVRDWRSLTSGFLLESFTVHEGFLCWDITMSSTLSYYHSKKRGIRM